MQTLSPTVVAAEYTLNAGLQVLLANGIIATVLVYEKDTRSGTWSRGFKYTNTTYGILMREFKTVGARYSADHGATWHNSLDAAKKQRAGRAKLAVHKSQEFAFDAIQKINKSYEAGYKWHA